MGQCQRRAEGPQQCGALPRAPHGRDRGCYLEGGSSDLTPASSSDGLCPAAAQKRSSSLCPAPAEGSSIGRTSEVVELHFLSGRVVQLQTQLGDNVATVKDKAACELKLPSSAVRLIRDGRILHIDEPIESCIGVPITVVVGGTLDRILSAAASDILRAFGYNVEHMTIPVGLLEFRLEARDDQWWDELNLDVATIAEVVEKSRPSRLIFSAHRISVAQLEAGVRDGMATLEYLRVDDVTRSTTSIDSVASLLHKCPNLCSCELRGAGVMIDGFSAMELGTLRSQFKVRITT